jgi:hypothetical protein
MEWFRMYNEARDDPKLLALPDNQFRVWFNLMCLASANPVRERRGIIEPTARRILALKVARRDVELLEDTLAILVELEIVADDGETITFLNWKKRQYESDSSTPRVRKFRESQRRDDETLQKRSTLLHETEGNVSETLIPEQSRAEQKQSRAESLGAGAPTRGKRASRPARLPEDYAITEAMREWAAEHCPAVDLDLHHERFCNHWWGKGETRADWAATWRNWMLREQDQMGRRPPPNGHRQGQIGNSAAPSSYFSALARKRDEAARQT